MRLNHAVEDTYLSMYWGQGVRRHPSRDPNWKASWNGPGSLNDLRTSQVLKRSLSCDLIPQTKLGLIKRAQFRSLACGIEQDTFHKDPDIARLSSHQPGSKVFKNKSTILMDWKIKLRRKGQAWKAKFKGVKPSWSTSCLAPPHSPRPPDQ